MSETWRDAAEREPADAHREEVRQLRASLRDALASLEWAVAIVQFDVEADNGHVCGPEAGCDGACAARHSMGSGLRRARAILAANADPFPSGSVAGD